MGRSFFLPRLLKQLPSSGLPHTIFQTLLSGETS